MRMAFPVLEERADVEYHRRQRRTKTTMEDDGVVVVAIECLGDTGDRLVCVFQERQKVFSLVK